MHITCIFGKICDILGEIHEKCADVWKLMSSACHTWERSDTSLIPPALARDAIQSPSWPLNAEIHHHVVMAAFGPMKMTFNAKHPEWERERERKKERGKRHGTWCTPFWGQICPNFIQFLTKNAPTWRKCMKMWYKPRGKICGNYADQVQKRGKLCGIMRKICGIMRNYADRIIPPLDPGLGVT